MPTIEELLRASAALHQHLCPRQVLGMRMGLLGGRWLGLDLPREDKRLLTMVETDGCAVDAIAIATGCRMGRRTMRLIDFGKMAATFVDTHTQRAVRVVPRPTSRERAWVYAPEMETRWEAQLLGYQRMPEAELLFAEEVALTFTLEKLLSKAGCRVICQVCGEEIINEREVLRDGLMLCRSCAGERYYRSIDETAPLLIEGLEALIEG